MKLRKNINRIALLTSLLMINTNVKGFYQCVPKKDWVLNIVKQKFFSRIYLSPNSKKEDFQQVLHPGKYIVIAAAAGSKEISKEFTLNAKAEFKACVGASAGSGGSGGNSGFGYGFSFLVVGGGDGVMVVEVVRQ